MAEAVGVSIWLIAPMGASAVLVFAVPASPLAQPWSVIVGNTLVYRDNSHITANYAAQLAPLLGQQLPAT
jgi:CBS-domain-containing membrane protein